MFLSVKISVFASSNKERMEEPMLIGINNRKVNCFPLFKSSFEALLPNIVIPLLDIPGKTLKH